MDIDKEAWPIARKLLLMNEVAATVELTHYLKKAYKQGRIDGLNEEPTEEMIKAGNASYSGRWLSKGEAEIIYKAMTAQAIQDCIDIVERVMPEEETD